MCDAARQYTAVTWSVKVHKDCLSFNLMLCVIKVLPVAIPTGCLIFIMFLSPVHLLFCTCLGVILFFF